MGKKKREHVVFDQMRKQKKSIPFAKVNKEVKKPQKSKGMQSQKKILMFEKLTHNNIYLALK